MGEEFLVSHEEEKDSSYFITQMQGKEIRILSIKPALLSCTTAAW